MTGPERWLELSVGKHQLVLGRACDLVVPGPTSLAGTGLAEIFALLRSRPDLARQMRDWLQRKGMAVCGVQASLGDFLERLALDVRAGRLGVFLHEHDFVPFAVDLWSIDTTGPAAPMPAPGGPVSGKLAVAAAAYAGAHSGGASHGKCYSAIKRALIGGGVTKKYLAGVAASGAGPELETLGYVNVLATAGYKSPYDAPVGAIIVYAATPDATDKNRQFGHIEFRTSDGFASDYHNKRARTGEPDSGMTGRGRTVSGIYILP